jgi:hypothetical protein
MKNIFNIKQISLSLSFVIIASVACKDDFLSVPAPGALSESLLSNAAGVEGMLVSSYGVLLGRGMAGNTFSGGSTNWLGGSVQGGEANKGSEGGDAPVMNAVMRFEMSSTHQMPAWKWAICYEAVSRANAVLRNVDKAGDMLAADKTRAKGEARFLRGHSYFELQKHFNKVPYIDENTADPGVVPNSGTVWTQIEADFKFAYDNLPETQAAAGRANKWAAGAYLGKAYLFQKKFDAAATLFETVIANGKTTNGKKYALATKYNDCFNAETENNEEHVFSVQAAANTGTLNNTQSDFVLNFTHNAPGAGCCGFFQPSFDMVNSYRTDANGLPLSGNTYNDPANAVKHDYKVTSAAAFVADADKLDARVDWVAGRRGVSYYDWGVHPGKDWVRDQNDAGPYTAKKFQMTKAQFTTMSDGSSGWGARGFTALNYPMVRFADVLLMAAEAHLEKAAPDLAKAKDYINMVRARAAQATGFVMNGATPAANYSVGQYPAFADQATARAAVRMERKLELSQEGHRFYDLVRWGIAKEEIDKYIANDSKLLTARLGGVTFVKDKHEYWPIPQAQIDLQGTSVLKQNPGY